MVKSGGGRVVELLPLLLLLLLLLFLVALVASAAAATIPNYVWSNRLDLKMF